MKSAISKLICKERRSEDETEVPAAADALLGDDTEVGDGSM